MDIGTYKQKRAREAQLKEEREQFFRNPCLKCHRPPKACFCDQHKPFDTKAHICLLMHPKEAKKEHVGTGRLTHLNLKNSSIIVDATFDKNEKVQELIKNPKYFPMVLYPGPETYNVSEESFDKEIFDGKVPLIFVIDGTWACAKSMMRDSKTLHNLPRISFTYTGESRFIIKAQPAKYCLSTIESVHVLLTELENRGVEKLDKKQDILLQNLDRLVKFQIDCANDPTIPSYRRGKYKSPNERTPAAKWVDRRICFEDKNYL